MVNHCRRGDNSALAIRAVTIRQHVCPSTSWAKDVLVFLVTKNCDRLGSIVQTQDRTIELDHENEHCVSLPEDADAARVSYMCCTPRAVGGHCYRFKML